MRVVLIAGAIMAGLCRAAVGEPEPLSDAKLERVAAGLLDTYLVMPVILVNNHNVSTVAASASENISSTAIANIVVNNTIDLAPTDQIGQLPAVVVNEPVGGTASGPIVTMPVLGGTHPPPSQLPVWVPWAAELRASLVAK